MIITTALQEAVRGSRASRVIECDLTILLSSIRKSYLPRLTDFGVGSVSGAWRVDLSMFLELRLLQGCRIFAQSKVHKTAIERLSAGYYRVILEYEHYTRAPPDTSITKKAFGTENRTRGGG